MSDMSEQGMRRLAEEALDAPRPRLALLALLGRVDDQLVEEALEQEEARLKLARLDIIDDASRVRLSRAWGRQSGRSDYYEMSDELVSLFTDTMFETEEILVHARGTGQGTDGAWDKVDAWALKTLPDGSTISQMPRSVKVLLGGAFEMVSCAELDEHSTDVVQTAITLYVENPEPGLEHWLKSAEALES